MKRPWWLLLGLLMLVGWPLVGGGCSPTPTPTAFPSPVPASPTPEPTVTSPATLPAAPSGLIVLTVWHSWDAEEAGMIRGLLAEYQGQNPGVTVRLRQVPVDQIVAEYEEAVLAGEGPDLLVGRNHWIGRLAQHQTIAPLDDLLDEEYWAGFYPFALEGVRVGERRYAVPYALETVALYYNRDFVAVPPTTTAALLDLAATWPEQEEGQAGLAFPLSYYNTVGYLYAFGGQLLDEAGQATLDTPAMRAWLTWLQQVRESPGVIATDSYGLADSRFKSGSVAMIVNGSWALSDYRRALGSERVGVTPLPMLSPAQTWPTPLVGYRVLMVNPVRLTEHPLEVLDLLCFLGGPSLQQLLAGRLNMVPTWSALDLAADPLLQSFAQQARLGRPRPPTPREELLWDPLETLLYNVTERRIPLDQALLETQRQVEQLLRESEEGR